MKTGADVGSRRKRLRLRFRLGSLLLLTTLVPISFVSWRAYWDSRAWYADQELELARQHWNELARENAAQSHEANARASYYQWRAERETALRRADVQGSLRSLLESIGVE